MWTRRGKWDKTQSILCLSVLIVRKTFLQNYRLCLDSRGATGNLGAN